MKRPKLWSRRNLPGDLWPGILSRLPVKTLLRFRAVSKQWRALIDDPDFARLHLRRFSKNRCQTNALVYQVPLQRNSLEVRCVQSLIVTSRLHIPPTIFHGQQKSNLWHAFSSIDGLFMLKKSPRLVYSHTPFELMLWNPATRKTLILPPSPEISDPVNRLSNLDLGLGFDPLIKDYKHVRVIQAFASGLPSIAVYSLKTNSWKITRCDQGFIQRLRISGDEDDTTLCLKGFLFHLAMVNESTLKDLVSFDLRRETLASTKLPVEDSDNDPYLRRSKCLTMADDGCSLALVMCLKGSGSVWVMEGLEADDIKCWTWSKRYTFSSMIPDFDSRATCGVFFYLLENGELLLRWNSMITSYNLNTNKEKVLLRKKFKNKASPYLESLVAIQ